MTGIPYETVDCVVNPFVARTERPKSVNKVVPEEQIIASSEGQEQVTPKPNGAEQVIPQPDDQEQMIPQLDGPEQVTLQVVTRVPVTPPLDSPEQVTSSSNGPLQQIASMGCPE
ncbi:uncharacterized protein LOC111083436 [Limulus polyphemus]|uniref:Uncharacterized protein LOC111083436 n=1 Tax=Limulus polyphemus TaxID=6850 RepID=A0ABM1RW97_LIMPO|nr:uncharacterized protein LOC111083436 [Limulus polyphemus]